MICNKNNCKRKQDAAYEKDKKNVESKEITHQCTSAIALTFSSCPFEQQLEAVFHHWSIKNENKHLPC
jgi:hypothetical protein